MKVAGFFEGPSDRLSIPTLMQKLRDDLKIEKRQVPAGDMLAPRKMRAHVGPLLVLHPDIERILIFRDCECTEPESLYKDARLVLKLLKDSFPKVKTSFVIVVHALESWLMGDPAAVEAVLGADAAKGLPANPESECRPKECLERLAPNFDYMRDDPRLAERADARSILSKCPSFRVVRTGLS